jgi:uncharacterized zinc-type alcohol dehydrogenase-like protein
MPEVRGYAAKSATSALEPFAFKRREPGEREVRIDILYCGICHSDIHCVRDEWGVSRYPMVPGHEIVGRVGKAGSSAKKFKVGDLAGVGCFVDSCRTCANCRRGLEQHCLKGATLTYNSPGNDGKLTYGGYSTQIVVDEAYALKVSPKLSPERAAPLLCAGITTYSPLRRWKAGPATRVGVLGLGGLGHMAVKLAAAMGAEVTVLSSSKSKAGDARRLGAREFVVASEDSAARKFRGSLDILIDTVSAQHDLDFFLRFLRTEGTLVLLGAPPKPLQVAAFSLIGGRWSLSGSNIGGIAETQEMLDFCAEKGVMSDVEVVSAGEINRAYERMLKGDVRFRFSIDAKTF